MERKWVGIAVPHVVAARIDAHLAADGTYTSRGEIVKAAVLEWLAKHQPMRVAAEELLNDVSPEEVRSA